MSGQKLIPQAKLKGNISMSLLDCKMSFDYLVAIFQVNNPGQLWPPCLSMQNSGFHCNRKKKKKKVLLQISCWHSNNFVELMIGIKTWSSYSGCLP